MLTFCNDIDLLHWEPNILRDAAFASQTLISGTGDLAGSTFTIPSGFQVPSTGGKMEGASVFGLSY